MYECQAPFFVNNAGFEWKVMRITGVGGYKIAIVVMTGQDAAATIRNMPGALPLCGLALVYALAMGHRRVRAKPVNQKKTLIIQRSDSTPIKKSPHPT